MVPSGRRRPAEVERLGHVVLGTTRFLTALDWYLGTLGLIVSDFLYLDGQRDRGPAMAFIRCDQGKSRPTTTPWPCCCSRAPGTSTPLTRSPTSTRWPQAESTCATGGYRHAWGIGRHIQGSQIFDYWRDPTG